MLLDTVTWRRFLGLKEAFGALAVFVQTWIQSPQV